ncbi:MAG: HAMP domain-containing protein [Calditrichaeota bacterium]|nr:MAG: HAMP domain-containing protein [Calditrichota bacterium]
MNYLRLNFRNRIFSHFAGLIFFAIILIIWAVSTQVKHKMKTTLNAELHNTNTILHEYLQARLDLLQAKGTLLAEEPRLKAAVDTNDPLTVKREAEKLLSLIESDFLLVTNHKNEILAQLGNLRIAQNSIENIASIKNAISFQQTSAMTILDAQVFQIISTPITIKNQFGELVILGTASIGFKIDVVFLDQLRELTGCQIGFVNKTGNDVSNQAFFSFQPEKLELLQSQKNIELLMQCAIGGQDIREVQMGDEKYLLLSTQFNKNTGNSLLLLLKSLNEAMQPILKPTLNMLLTIGVIAILISLVLSYFLAYGVTKPVSKLALAINRVSTGDLESSIPVEGYDEVAHLAQSFEQMRLSLKKNIEELERTFTQLVQSEKLATTGRLMAQLSHEINNPVHNIRSALESALKKPRDAESAATLIEIAHEEILRLSKLLRQTLDFYRPGSVERVALDVNKVIEELIAVSEKNFAKSGIKIRSRLQPDLCKVIANRDQLKQVFLNIMLNAKEAVAGTGEIFIATTNLNKSIRIEIEDTGGGIEPELQHKIFDAFVTTKSKVTGVGLGLSVSYEIIQQHKGDIRVESTIGEGTRFIIELPAE